MSLTDQESNVFPGSGVPGKLHRALNSGAGAGGATQQNISHHNLIVVILKNRHWFKWFKGERGERSL